MPEIRSERILLHGHRFDVHAMELLGDDGQTYTREVIRHPGAVVLLPILDQNRVVLIENQRPTVNQTLWELPAGTREAGETAEATAARELIEETGYRAGKLDLVHEFYSAPGICDELMALFVARELTLGSPRREAIEQITNRIATRDEVAAWVADGRVRDAKTLVGLYAFLYSPLLNP